ncbi:hypothetical protein [Ruegeria jejuensis]|uniref:hypothetical protein n=1 Tax=Ruegeria jejuensis TaxID=3233338 RepID=UPI00355AD745
MDLAIQAVRYKIWLVSFGAIVFLAFGLWQVEASYVFVALSLGTLACILVLVGKGLRSEKLWVAVLFGAYCIFDFLSAMAQGLSLGNIIDLADAVLSFVALCGIIIWYRERRASQLSG